MEVAGRFANERRAAIRARAERVRIGHYICFFPNRISENEELDWISYVENACCRGRKAEWAT